MSSAHSYISSEVSTSAVSTSAVSTPEVSTVFTPTTKPIPGNNWYGYCDIFLLEILIFIVALLDQFIATFN